MSNLFVRTITLVMILFFCVSCGNAPSNVLTGVKVSTETRNGNVWLSFAADLNLGAMSFASISVPVLHPRGQTPIGQLDLTSGLNGVSNIKISVDVTELADVETSTATLPNGNMIPLIANNQVIAVNIGNGARVYLAISEKVTAIGVAVPISAFDSIGRTLPGLNFFPVVSSGDVIGTAGIFTGLNPGQSGIAVVADVSKLVNGASMLDNASGTFSTKMALQAEELQPAIKLDYRSQTASASQKAKLDSMIFDLHKKKAVLKMR
jgi:hypothetical protein